MNWFKMFCEARNDAKLRSLTDAQHRTWFRLLCYAAEQAERGKVGPTPLHVVALEVADGSVSLLEETCNALQALQCVTWSKGDAAAVEIEFCSFARRQGPKPSDDPERVRDRVAKHRANTRPAKTLGPAVRAATLPVTPPGNACNALHETCNAPVTPLDKNREEKNNTPLPPTGGVSVGDGLEPFDPGPATSGARPPEGWTAEHQRVLDRNTERFGASNGDRIVADLLRDFSPRVVAAACDVHHSDTGGAIDGKRLRGICRAMHDGRWSLPGSPRAAAPPKPDNRRIFTASPEQRARYEAEQATLRIPMRPAS